MAEFTYDVVVIGSGPGGYVAAIRASQLGMKAAVVERGDLGGVCLNVGCIPTKAMLHSAEVLDEAKEGKRVGVIADNVRVDWSGVMGHKDRVVKQMVGGVGGLMRKNKIDVLRGFGKLTGPNTVSVAGDEGEQSVTARFIIIATGGAPRSLPFAPIDEDVIVSSTGALALKDVPKSLTIIGGGVIGCEFASAYRTFGSEVTIVEAFPRLITTGDEEVSAELQKVFSRRGIKLQLSAKVAGVEKTANGVVVSFTTADGKEQKLKSEKLLMAVGRGPLTKNIGLEDVGVATDERGYVTVNGMMQTSVPNIYSIGDCVPTPWLAHVASAEGVLAVEHMAGRHVEPINYEKVPACTYSSPEVASVGLTEAQAKERGYDIKVSRFPFAANGKAAVLADRTGFVKIIADTKYDEILGIHMIGPHVTELIAEGGIALSHEATGESLVHTIHAHPTLYEAIGEAAHGLFEGPLNF